MRRKIERHLKNIALNLFNNIKMFLLTQSRFFINSISNNTKCVVFTTRELRSVLSYLKRKA